MLISQNLRNHTNSTARRFTRQFTFHVGCSWASKPRLDSEEDFKKKSAYSDKHEVAQWRTKMLGDRYNLIGDAGEDFWFIEPLKNDSGIALGVADGVGGWFSAKVDPSKFSQTLMWAASKKAGNLIASEAQPKDLIEAGHQGVLKMEEVKAGSSTACIVTLDAKTGLLKGANLGDSTFILIRDNEVVESTKQQTHFFNCPYQLAKLRKGIDKNHITDYANSADLFETTLQEGDCIVLFTDGLGDNVFTNEIVQLKQAVEGHIPDGTITEKSQALADTLVSYARICMDDEFKVSPIELSARQEKIKGFMGGKVDDVTVITAFVQN
ncbi:protein serine/threonine phosphatase 2C [Wallemia mellicola CBS 633.66]|uniref:Protein phosphatase n=1 Tax=Wallemia mellicola (strain ATCC MYA-4683 / CBS 633.66) TaxID=671144 RepID=I4YAC6_WALMC|nr:protein serine/threonine phosphatase 2C [Wallemia mellicola CBS 633.66]EIM20918.1 protein serine/threonine phosphatase 2C [Wallemia mellicola CBS 633.66]TIB86977.1 protein serine/threonine phosphatase 2C [Wallemia mellicola]|eukprot:XP_006958916.1 protein serine/threonine phosphatase 2C [Wallemia mellicola CBS 633.66]